MRRRADVVFCGHDATRTGAPLVLLYFLRWLREHTDLTFEVVLVDGGPLVDDFRALAPTRVLAELRDHAVSRALGRAGLSRLAATARSVQARVLLRRLRKVRTVYCNSISSVQVLRMLGRAPGRVVISHIHEMEGAFRTLGPVLRDFLLAETDHFIAVSDLVRTMLTDTFGVDPARVSRHYEFIDVAGFLASRPEHERVEDLRKECGIPEDAWVIGAVGVTQWRKGPDLFLLLAQILARRPAEREVHLVWVGADPNEAETMWLRHDIELGGLADRVHLRGVDDRPARWFALFDVFVLTSREDPFPLVCLESSLAGTPIVCFDNTGMVEFADDGRCGVVVSYLDIEAMADEVLALLADPERRRAIADRAAAKVRADHDIPSSAAALHAELEAHRARG
ncbi:MAG TPA: glycosyltransferase [Acidimicrobiales bacterium]|nr:glycosyltransferase [Acidimicrobiales bacterium]